MDDRIATFVAVTRGSRDYWPLVQSIFWLALVFFLLALSVYLVRKLQRSAEQPDASAGELLSEFRDLHDRGTLSDAEYKTIRSKLSSKVRDELSGNEQSS